jgi:hypothetical protein
MKQTTTKTTTAFINSKNLEELKIEAHRVLFVGLQITQIMAAFVANTKIFN